MLAEAITCLDSKIKEQSEAQQKQVLEIEELKRKVSILEQHDNGKSIRQLIDIATKVSMMKLDDKIHEATEKLQSMHDSSQTQMNNTIFKNGLSSKDQRDEIKLLVARLEKRVGELTKDSSKMQKTTDSVHKAMKELELLESKIIGMVNNPDPITESRIKQLEIISEGSVASLSRIEFFTYLDEFRTRNNEIVEKLIEDGIRESYKKVKWGLGYDGRNDNPTYRSIEIAKRSASIRACSENANARIRAYSQNECK